MCILYTLSRFVNVSAFYRIWNFNEEAGFSQVLHLDTPKSVVPGSEYGELIVAGGLALGDLSTKSASSGLTNALASITSLLTLQHFANKVNISQKEKILKNLPSEVSLCKTHVFYLQKKVYQPPNSYWSTRLTRSNEICVVDSSAPYKLNTSSSTYKRTSAYTGCVQKVK